MKREHDILARMDCQDLDERYVRHQTEELAEEMDMLRAIAEVMREFDERLGALPEWHWATGRREDDQYRNKVTIVSSAGLLCSQ
jgi:hypothetical protein